MNKSDGYGPVKSYHPKEFSFTHNMKTKDSNTNQKRNYRYVY